jgi:hypothetical protein
MNRYLTVLMAAAMMSMFASASEAQRSQRVRRAPPPRPVAVAPLPTSCPEGRLQSGKCAPVALAQMMRQLGIVQTQWHISYSAPIYPVGQDGTTQSRSNTLPYYELRHSFSGHQSP